MPGVGFVDMKVKALFFDRPKVARAMTDARRRALSKSGAFVRRKAQTSMREAWRNSVKGG